MQRGRTLAQITEARVTAEYDAKWGRGFIQPAVFVQLVHRSLSAR